MSIPQTTREYRLPKVRYDLRALARVKREATLILTSPPS